MEATTTSALTLLVAWYGPGFAAAWIMARRGADPLPWVFAAWLVGAVAAAVAICYVVKDRRDRTRATPGSRPMKGLSRPDIGVSSRMERPA